MDLPDAFSQNGQMAEMAKHRYVKNGQMAETSHSHIKSHVSKKGVSQGNKPLKMPAGMYQIGQICPF